MENLIISKTKKQADYELLDSGEGEKLERYGNFVISRPDPQALWPKNKSSKVWEKVDAVFTRDEKDANWKIKNQKLPDRWKIEFGDLNFFIKPTAFKHTGIFPEHLGNWSWLKETIEQAHRPVTVLNLFGYTGGASLACAQSGAEVCHVDGSKSAIKWARDNAEISGLTDKPIRWILDDAQVFVSREIKRGRKYDGIIMDPPAFGHGPNGEMWKIEKDFLPFLEMCKSILSDEPLFFLINGYASGYSALAYENNLLDLKNKFGGETEKGELTIEETKSGRLLPCGIFARWRKLD